MSKSLKGFLVAVGVLVVAGFGYAYYQGMQSPSAETNENGIEGTNEAGTDVNGEVPSSAMPAPGSNVDEMVVSPDGDTNTVAEDTSSVKTFNVTGANFSFTPSTMTVKKGDTVKVVLNSSNGFHDFVIDEFNAKTDRISDGQTTQVQFVADKAGTFEYYCSVGNHRQMGMVGKLIVE